VPHAALFGRLHVVAGLFIFWILFCLLGCLSLALTPSYSKCSFYLVRMLRPLSKIMLACRPEWLSRDSFYLLLSSSLLLLPLIRSTAPDPLFVLIGSGPKNRALSDCGVISDCWLGAFPVPTHCQFLSFWLRSVGSHSALVKSPYNLICLFHSSSSFTRESLLRLKRKVLRGKDLCKSCGRSPDPGSTGSLLLLFFAKAAQKKLSYIVGLINPAIFH
jgi:hypothetical protein